MIDITVLAQSVTALLAPALPFLVKAGEQVGTGALEKMGADAWERSQALWLKLRPRLEAKPAAQEAVIDVAAAPADEGAQASLRHQIKKLLTDDTELAAEVATAFTSTPASSVLLDQRSGGFDIKGSATFHGDAAGRNLYKGDK
jgi:hypothetical protein